MCLMNNEAIRWKLDEAGDPLLPDSWNKSIMVIFLGWNIKVNLSYCQSSSPQLAPLNYDLG